MKFGMSIGLTMAIVQLFAVPNGGMCGEAHTVPRTDRGGCGHVFSMSCKVTSLNGPLATEAGRAGAIAWLRRNHFTALWLESYRHGERVESERLVGERDAFRAAGFDVRGLVTPTMLNDAGADGKVPMVVCWSDPKARSRLKAECLRAADVFTVVIIDDFLFSSCGEGCVRCKADKARRGISDWGAYRRALMLEVCESDILAPVRAAHPNAKFIIKYPCWYKKYARNGYDPERQNALFGACWIGTETRDANPNPLQACWIMDWMDRLAHGNCGGGWYDALDCSPEKFVEQAYYTILGGARESLVHCYDYLLAANPGKTPFGEKVLRAGTCAEALANESDCLKSLGDMLFGAERLGFEMGKDGVSRHRFRKDGKTILVRFNTTGKEVDGLPPHRCVWTDCAVAPFAPGERIAVLGDSITKQAWYLGYLQLHANLAMKGGDVKLINLGIAGDTAAGALERYDWDIRPVGADRIFVMFGMNDVAVRLYDGKTPTAEQSAVRERKLADYARNLCTLVDRLRTDGRQVVLMTPTPYDEYSKTNDGTLFAGANEKGLFRCAEIVRRLAAEERLPCIDLHRPLTEAWKNAPEPGYTRDRIHPNEAGARLVAAEILMAMGVEVPSLPTNGLAYKATMDLCQSEARRRILPQVRMGIEGRGGNPTDRASFEATISAWRREMETRTDWSKKERRHYDKYYKGIWDYYRKEVFRE